MKILFVYLTSIFLLNADALVEEDLAKLILENINIDAVTHLSLVQDVKRTMGDGKVIPLNLVEKIVLDRNSRKELKNMTVIPRERFNFEGSGSILIAFKGGDPVFVLYSSFGNRPGDFSLYLVSSYDEDNLVVGGRVFVSKLVKGTGGDMISKLLVYSWPEWGKSMITKKLIEKSLPLKD